RYVPPLGALPPRRSTPSGGMPSPGRSGIERGSRDDAAATVLTPSPDPRRTDRENAARRRVALLREHLLDARKQLDSGELQLAQAACERALKLDDAPPEGQTIPAEIHASR